jgi:Raf kinase inhibitor-like YbhB/YbcL family protein
MHHFRAAAICSLILLGSAGAALAQGAGAPAPQLTLSSTAFKDGGMLADANTAVSAKPVSPELSWVNPPAGTVSFALLVHDMDAVTGKTSEDHLHWGIFNIPASVHELPEAVPNMPKLPDGSIQIKSSAPFVDGYRGPAFKGPNNFHHYAFELYALDATLPIGPEASRPDLLKAMDGHILAQASIVALKH